MREIVRVGIVGAALLASTALAAPDYVVQRHQEIISPSVSIWMDGGSGSGTVIAARPDSNGCRNYVLTAAHVAGDLETVRIQHDTYSSDLHEWVGYMSYTGIPVAVDAAKDLALVYFHSAKCLPVAKLADAGETYVGEDVFAYGAAWGQTAAITEGQLGSVVEFDSGKRQRFTATIHPGNSGGGLFHMDEITGEYELNGVPVEVSAYRDGWGNAIPLAAMSFAVPTDMIHAFLDDSGFAFYGEQVAVK